MTVTTVDLTSARGTDKYLTLEAFENKNTKWPSDTTRSLWSDVINADGKLCTEISMHQLWVSSSDYYWSCMKVETWILMDISYLFEMYTMLKSWWNLDLLASSDAAAFSGSNTTLMWSARTRPKQRDIFLTDQPSTPQTTRTSWTPCGLLNSQMSHAHWFSF